MPYAFIAAIIAASVPFISHASIVISEVAWMGSASNANAEWIELYNTGSTQTLDGWTLSAVDGQPHIKLSGTLRENSFALLERTSDDTVPGIPAFLIYTGALGNTGEILELRDANGVLIDRVDGSDNWAIGGDNVTKDTLQRSGNPPVSSFITAPPTPGMGGGTPRAPEPAAGQSPPSTSVSPPAIGSSVRTIESSTVDGGTVRVRLEPALTLLLPLEQTVTAGVPTTFRVQAFREGGTETDLHEAVWNFGDGTVVRGATPTHTYRYPGSYAVLVVGKRTNFTRELSAEARMVVRVAAPELDIIGATDEYIEVQNKSAVEVDLSGFTLVAGDVRFRIPDSTRILADHTIRFHSAVTGLSRASRSLVTLLHPSGAVFSTFRTVEPMVLAEAATSPEIQRAVPVATATPPPPPAIEQQEQAEEPVQDEVIAVVAREDDSASFLWWSVLALVVSILAVFVMITITRRERVEDDPLSDIEIEIEDGKQ